ILPEVQAVCDRIVIINQGRIIADEKTENITRVVEENRKYNVKVCGPQREVQAAIKGIPGVVAVDATGERDGDSYTFQIEAEKGNDLRKALFYAMSERNWPIIGLEAVGMNLEEVFIKIMDADLSRKR
ncbi:MAG: ABC transporter, partial [Clostridia bacterium]|nr:ABC transporter [Clostridia bacterium]